METLRRLFRGKDGGIAIEYALIAALVSLSLIFGANQIGSALTYVYDSLAAAFPSA
ncbi:Flp pilus assembly pilin Flp [Ensifer sp. KUDG1]|uniref:Flp family type IVb pilin n=1 Tax=unclassified Ensifer TaxID=2633371 RepID=UPI0009DDCC69|nr:MULTISPECIES: Flp family type IVb pilin [unclassified Ensifer]MBD9651965.1 Flp family type IVb pilin [Ensifer sp. ENS09]QRY67785.1 Flp family type IVb pilin [Ensifer sp. PDNC004]